MVFVQERKVKGGTYIYLEKPVRIGNKVHKVSKYLGKKKEVSKERIKKALKAFILEVDSKILSLLIRDAKRKYKHLTYPLDIEEIRKIEEMNLKYKTIKSSLSKQDWIDIKKRFVANFVFESNALEGNSLTLKNFSEIVFENKIHEAADLREVYDAKNSYAVFSSLFNAKKEISEDLILEIHKNIMKNIDKRIGYKKVPNIILGRKLQLTPPENVGKDTKKLVGWYKENKEKMHPLELAFRFHHAFEKIHPFSDGNGRVGRMLLNYILIKKGYFPIVIRKIQRARYIKALEAADLRSYTPLIRFALDKAKETYRKFFEVYYQYI